MGIHLKIPQISVKKVTKKVQVTTSFLHPNYFSSYQKYSKKCNTFWQKLKFECSFHVEKWIMQETEKNKLNLVGFLHIFLISIYLYLENHFPFECFPNIKARNFHQHFTSMTEAKQHIYTGWHEPSHNFKEINIAAECVDAKLWWKEKKPDILLRDISKMWLG